MNANELKNVDKVAGFLLAMANAKRLSILEHLLDKELTVNVIAEKVNLSQSALSQHLAKLRYYNLVQTRRDRQMVYYSCKSDAVRQTMATLRDIFD